MITNGPVAGYPLSWCNTELKHNDASSPPGLWTVYVYI